MNNKNAIELRNVNLTYSYDVEDNDKKRSIIKKVSKIKAENHVLDNINLDVRKGEILGIIGINGSGKSSLLSIMARIIEPDSGTVEINGKIATILELGMGFHPDLSGRDNIILKGELYGFSKKEMESKMESIIDYSGIKKYIDNPIRTYSSGMRSRLAFSIMINVDAEIMLVDEILSTGDAAFSAKASDFFKKILKDGKTVVYVSHSPGSIENLCTRAIWLDKGKIISDGKPKKVAALYNEATMESLDVVLDQAKFGLSEAQYRLSQFYKDGINVEKDEDAYRNWLELAAEQGHLKAQIELADILMMSDNEDDRDTAIMYYQSSATRGDSTARSKLSLILGKDNSKNEWNELKKIFRHFANLGSSADMMRYANFLLKTAWVDEDRTEAFQWYEKIAKEYEHPDAIIQLAIMYRDGIGVKKDKKKYIEILEKGTSLGILKTMIWLADAYSTGSIINEDQKRALELYEYCALNGSNQCQYTVAMMYLEGKGTEINQEKAKYWFNVYSKSLIIAYQLNAISLLKNNAIPYDIDINELYESISDSKDTKALLELNDHLKNGLLFNDLEIIQKINDVNESLSKSYGKGMDVAFTYYSRPGSIGFNKIKATEIGIKNRYQSNPEALYRTSLLCSESKDEKIKSIGKSCLIQSARAGYHEAIKHCNKESIPYMKEWSDNNE